MASFTKPKKPDINTRAVQKSVNQVVSDEVQKNGVPSYKQVDIGSQGTAKPQAAAAPGTTQSQGYQSGYQKQLDDTMNRILNREDFSYDLNGDALWKQYQDQYTQKGKMAMMDTMGQAAAMTGGYGSSYGQTVGQQAYQGYLQEMNQMIPELYQLALQRYQMEGDQLMDQYDLIADQDDRAYGRYVDDRNWQYQQDRDTVTDSQWQQQFDYQQSRDQISDERYDQEWEYQVGRDQVEDQRYDQEWQYQQDRDQIEDQRYQDQWEYEQSRDQIEDERYDREWEYQQGRDQVSDDQWQAEFDEDKRRYDQEWEYEQSRGSGGSGGSSGSGGSELAEESGVNYGKMDQSALRSELSSCSSKEEAENYAAYMISQGADEDLVWAAYASIWDVKATNPPKEPVRKDPHYTV